MNISLGIFEIKMSSKFVEILIPNYKSFGPLGPQIFVDIFILNVIPGVCDVVVFGRIPHEEHIVPLGDDLAVGGQCLRSLVHVNNVI